MVNTMYTINFVNQLLADFEDLVNTVYTVNFANQLLDDFEDLVNTIHCIQVTLSISCIERILLADLDRF